MKYTKDRWAEYREQHRESLREKSREYYLKNKEKRKAYIKAWRQINLELQRYKSSENNKKRRLIILAILGSKCTVCGFDDWRALQIDHVHGGGSVKRKTMPHATSLTYWKKELEENADAYQILCANCNWIKRYEKNELYKNLN